MNPFDGSAKRLDDCIMDWKEISPAPYDKRTVDPYTRTRVILMNGTEFEAVWFGHQFSRHCQNGDVRRSLAMMRRCEQQQQKLVSALKPADETLLEHTIGYEQLAVDLTAGLALRETDQHVKAALDFALLEDFDHLYRYANLLAMEGGTSAETLVGALTEVMPGRPTIAHHRHPYDSIKMPVNGGAVPLATKLCTNIITAAEQQTMNFYMNVSGAYPNDRGRALYREIGMVEEQHVSQYGSLLDVSASWLERLVMHQYTECYLYYSCHETESNPAVRAVWETLYEQERAHLYEAVRLLRKEEGKEYEQVVGAGDFPPPLALQSQIPYVRDVLARSVQMTACRESYTPVARLEPDADFFHYQSIVNADVNAVASHTVIMDRITQRGMDVRFETSQNPIPALRDRETDNTKVGRFARNEEFAMA